MLPNRAGSLWLDLVLLSIAAAGSFCKMAVSEEISKVNPVYEEEEEATEMEIHPTHIHGKHAKSVRIGGTEGSDQRPLLLDTSAAMTGTSATYKFSDDMPGQGSLFDDKDSKVASTAGTTPISFRPNKASADDVNQHVMSKMNERVAAMEQPDERARDYLGLTQFTIILSIVCAFFPYNFLCLIAVYMLSTMVTHRNDEKDYLSARTSSRLAFACNLIALIFGGVITFTLFVTFFVLTVIAIDALNNP